MKKITLTILILSLIVIVTQKSSLSFAKENRQNNFGLSITKSEDNESTSEGKNKPFFKFKDDRNKFMIKGVITASGSGSLIINSNIILLDPSITGNLKIVGTVKTGAYAMVQGEIKNSNYYATKIIIDQRNKKDLDKNTDAENSASNSGDLNKNNPHIGITTQVVTKLEDLINFLKNFLSKI